MLLLQRFHKDKVPGKLVLLAEGAIAATVGALFAAWLFPAEASLLSVFLAAILTEESVERLLAWNRKRILEEKVRPAVANADLVGRVVVLFLGTLVGFSILGLALPLDRVELLFGHQLEPYVGRTFTDLSFGSITHLLLHNAYVFFFFLAIALPFRHDGVMFAVAWNASVWGASFGLLARQWSSTTGPGLVEAYLRVATAVTPHMALEAGAYVLAGISGVFLRNGIRNHGLGSRVMLSILQSVGFMVAIGLALIVLGAVWEAFMGPRLVGWLSGGI